MKKMLLYFIVFMLFVGCEDVVEIETPSEAPRLVVDALIRVDESQPTLNLVVKVGLTSSFFEPAPVTGLTQITITSVDGNTTMGDNIKRLIERAPGSGVYQATVNTSFVMEGELLLQIEHEGQRYLASTFYVPSVPIDSLEQKDGTLFGGDETEIEITFTDPVDRNDYYLFDFDFDEFLVTEDEFYQGQSFVFSYFYDSDIRIGQEVTISILGVDEQFFSYMNQLIEQSGDSMGPFGTPVATVRGNLINVTDIDNDDVFDNVDDPNNFALGYFAVVQEFKSSIVIQDL